MRPSSAPAISFGCSVIGLCVTCVLLTYLLTYLLTCVCAVYLDMLVVS